MSDAPQLVKRGRVSLYSASNFFKKWDRKYLALHNSSRSGVKRLELFESEIKFKKQSPQEIVSLVECVRIVTCQRRKSLYTFEVRTSVGVYLFATDSFSDSNDWVNCLRVVAFGSSAANNKLSVTSLTSNSKSTPTLISSTSASCVKQQSAIVADSSSINVRRDVLLSQPAHCTNNNARARQRQPSCRNSAQQQLQQQQQPPPPPPLPMLQISGSQFASKNETGADTITPTVHALLLQSVLGGATTHASSATLSEATPVTATKDCQQRASKQQQQQQQHLKQQTTPTNAATAVGNSNKPLVCEDNLLYCSIEDNPNEHTYRVKVIQTELATRCQLKCYARVDSIAVCQQYEQISNFNNSTTTSITFYQLIVGPQELTLLNDYATNLRSRPAISSQQQQQQQQGLWSWPYQCIRRYSFDCFDCFVFEAGRKCSSGPGEFVVQTPKAQNIYKDVVNFVNELRTLSSSSTGQLATTSSSNSGIAASTIPHQQQQQQHNSMLLQLQTNDAHTTLSLPSIVQIPISWDATTSTNDNNKITQSNNYLKPIDQHQQQQQHEHSLFKSTNLSSQQSSLFENNNSSNLLTTTTAAAATPCLPQTRSSLLLDTSPSSSSLATSSPSASQSIESNSPTELTAALTSDETDESGYDQCSDAFGTTTTTTATTASSIKLEDSMHHASKSKFKSIQRSFEAKSKSNQHASNTTKHNTTTSKQLQNKTTNNTNSNVKQRKKLLGELITTCDNSFDVNIIRDIYSDITQEAKFAIVVNNGDDSINSTATQSTSGNSGDETENFEEDDEDDEDEDEDRSSINNSSSVESGIGISESKSITYSNNSIKPKLLSCQPKQRQNMNQKNKLLDTSIESHQYCHDSSPSLPPRPAFMRRDLRSVLHPIPECNEQNSQFHQQQQQHQQHYSHQQYKLKNEKATKNTYLTDNKSLLKQQQQQQQQKQSNVDNNNCIVVEQTNVQKQRQYSNNQQLLDVKHKQASNYNNNINRHYYVNNVKYTKVSKY